MDEVLRKRLSSEEIDAYDACDRRASAAGHFVVWPTIAGVISYSGGRLGSALVCLAIVLAAFPFMVIMGKRARKLRERAEDRFAATMGDDGTDKAPETNRVDP